MPESPGGPGRSESSSFWARRSRSGATLSAQASRSSEAVTRAHLLLILFSAAIHLVAHVALRKAKDRLALSWWTLVAGGVLLAPLLIWLPPKLPLEAWGWLALSAGFESIYFVALARAYASGAGISEVYPLARGTAPVLVLLWATLWLREPPAKGGLVGILVIAAGLYLLNLPSLGAWLEPFRALARPGPRWALLAGFGISLYTIVDRVGVKLVDPLLYTYLVFWLTWIVVTPLVLRTVPREVLLAEWRRGWPAIVLSSLTSFTAYSIVLFTIRHGTPASYAAATREVSVVFGVVVGITFLGERRTVMKLVGAVCVAGGVALIKVLG